MKNPKIIQFVFNTLGKSGVSSLMADIARKLRIPTFCIKKTIFEPRFESIKPIGTPAEEMILKSITY